MAAISRDERRLVLVGRKRAGHLHRRLAADVVFFMSWGGKWSLARNNNVCEFLSNPRVINRDDLPKGLAGGP